MKQRGIDRWTFLRYVEKYLGRKVSTIWRIEWEKRKSGRNRGKFACHHHLLLYGVDFIPVELVRKWWAACIQWKQYVVVWVEATFDGEGAAKYVAKYCAKVASSGYLVNPSYLSNVGRYWGVTRSKNIPRFAPKVFYNLPPDQVTVLVAVASAMLSYYDSRYDMSFTLLGKSAVELAEIFWANSLDFDSAMSYLEKQQGGEGRKTTGNG